LLKQCPYCWVKFEKNPRPYIKLQKYCSKDCRYAANQLSFFSKKRIRLRKSNYVREPEPVLEINSDPNRPIQELVLTQGQPITPNQRVVEAFKRITGHRNDKEWDKQYFPRYSRVAARMIDYLGDYNEAVRFVVEVYEALSNKGEGSEKGKFAPYTMEGLEKTHGSMEIIHIGESF